MKRVLALGAVIAVGLYATGAWSAAPPTSVERKLQKDVAALKAQVKTLQANVKKASAAATSAEEVAVGIGIIGACNVALTADAFQGTWQVIDQLSTATQSGKTYFGSQSPVDDTIGGEHICQAIRVPRSQAVPPNTAPFSALLALYQQPAVQRWLELQSENGG